MKDIQQSSGFDEFWAKYPKRVAKGAARRAYAKALKLTDHETIMEGLDAFIAHLDKQKPEKRFICHASTWLNQERWEDHYEDVGEPLTTQDRLRWEERYRRDPRLVPAGIQRIFGIGPYARG